MLDSPYNDNELSFNQCKAQKFKALSVALSAECALMPSVLGTKQGQYSENRAEELWEMIKELHSNLNRVQFETFIPVTTIVTTPPATPVDDEIPF